MNETENFHRNVCKEINLDNLYSALVQCFSIILCGFIAGRLRIISQREINGLDVFVRTFSLPSVIFISLAQLDLSHVNWTFLASILVSKSIVFVGVIVVTFFLIRPAHFGKLGLYAVFCTQSNDFAIGFTILTALYGKDHPDYPSYVYLLTPISLVFLNPIAYALLEIGKLQNKKEDTNKLENETSSRSIPSVKADTSETVENSQAQLQPNLSDKTPLDASRDKKSTAKLCRVLFTNICTSPIMIMTVLGMSANFIYKYISFLKNILGPFATVFSTMALFALGLRMNGTVNKLKGGALLTPGILIITKLPCYINSARVQHVSGHLFKATAKVVSIGGMVLRVTAILVFPLITREIVSLLRPGVTANDTLDLSSLGFMYGTFPTAPMAFVLSTQYDVEFETISSSLVVCTFLSGPLMYISAKMIFIDFIPTDDYYKKLQSFEFNIGVIGIPLGIWLIVVFIANKSFSKIPHKISGCLIISQVLLCVGVALGPLVTPGNIWFEYVQLSIVALGLYSSRLWTFILAVTLVVLQSRSLCFVLKLVPLFFCLGWGVPVILVSAACFTSFPDHPFGSLINPTFRYGAFQSVVTLLVLAVSFLGTSICLILQHRYQRKFAKYLVLVQEINSKDLREVNETNIGECSRGISDSFCCERRQKVTDIEEIVPYNDKNVCNGNCEQEDGLCSSRYSCTDSQRELCEETLKQYNEVAVNDEMDECEEDRQILRHIVLLLLLVTSLFVNLMLSIWTLVVEDAITGVYIELLFLNVMLNTGQIFLTFPIFGFDSRALFVSLTNRWRKFYYGADTVVLTPIEELGFETTHVCHQFIAHHLRDCERDIAKNKRLRLRMYKDCFKGRTLVSWLEAKHLAKNEAEAIQYASHLLEGRVLRHVENRHHFENSDLLYTFKQ